MLESTLQVRKKVDTEMMNILKEKSGHSNHMLKARETAISAAIEAAKKSDARCGSAFRSLIENRSLTKKPDQVLAAIQYLREVEGLDDSPPRVLKELFDDSGLTSPDNLSLYLNRLVERGFISCPPGSSGKNRYAVLTPEGRAHLDRRSGA